MKTLRADVSGGGVRPMLLVNRGSRHYGSGRGPSLWHTAYSIQVTNTRRQPWYFSFGTPTPLLVGVETSGAVRYGE